MEEEFCIVVEKLSIHKKLIYKKIKNKLEAGFVGLT